MIESCKTANNANALEIKKLLTVLTQISTQFSSINESIKRIPDMNQIAGINQLSVNKLNEIQNLLLEIMKK